MTDTRQAEELRAQARAWLEENWDPEITLGEWWERLGESGWAFPTWPKEWFGRGVPGHLAGVVADERRRIRATGPPSGIGVMMAGPAIIDHGTDEQKSRFLPNMVTGKEVWCQLFSEPGAGSDLAGLQTKAVADGTKWIVNGQKLRVSGAQYAKWGILIARTDPEVPKHAGITYFVIDMEQSGIEVRPLHEMSGGTTFNEVFFTDAEALGENVIGGLGQGWKVAVTTLAHERRSMGAGLLSGGAGGATIGKMDLSAKAGAGAKGSAGGEAAALQAMFSSISGQMIKMLPQLLGKTPDAATRQDIARLYTLLEIARFTELRTKAALARGERPGPEASTGKLLIVQIVRLMRDTALRMAGAQGMLTGKDGPLGGMLATLALTSPALSIAGGTDEIQRNVIAERVLGLPPEPQLGKDLPFRELKVGTRHESQPSS